MPTVFTHAVVGATIAALGRSPGPRLWLACAACAAVLDLDVVGVWLGAPWGHVLGHRGITHSLAFAAALAALVAAALRGHGSCLGAGLLIFAATASHGVLDAMTDGGLGVAFLAPFDDGRYFLPWRPIPVSPIGVRRFLSARGAAVMQAEIVMIWLPTLVVSIGGIAWRWRRSRRA